MTQPPSIDWVKLRFPWFNFGKLHKNQETNTFFFTQLLILLLKSNEEDNVEPRSELPCRFIKKKTLRSELFDSYSACLISGWNCCPFYRKWRSRFLLFLPIWGKKMRSRGLLEVVGAQIGFANHNLLPPSLIRILMKTSFNWCKHLQFHW